MNTSASPVQPVSHSRSRSWKFLALAVGLILGAVVTLIEVMATDFPVDMIIYREGVRAFMEGRSLYAEPMHAGDIALPFIYPPFGALVMVPLTAPAWLTHDAAGNIMIVISNLAVLAVLLGIFRQLTGRRGLQLLWPIALLWPLVLAFEPIRLNNSFAQINILIMALVAADLIVFPRRPRWLPRGMFIGLAAAIKLTPLAMLLFFLLRKEIKPIVTAAVSAILATAAAAAYRWDAFVEFFTVKLLDMGTGKDFGVGTDYQSNSSLKAVLTRLAPTKEAAEAHASLISAVWLVLVIAAIIGAALMMRALMRRGLDVEAWLLNSALMLLISPVSWSHHWVWLALIIPVAFYRAWQSRHAHWLFGSLLAVLFAWAAMLLTVPPKWWFGDAIDVYGQPWYQKFLVDDFVWLTFVVVALAAVLLRLTGPSTDSPTRTHTATAPQR